MDLEGIRDVDGRAQWDRMPGVEGEPVTVGDEYLDGETAGASGGRSFVRQVEISNREMRRTALEAPTPAIMPSHLQRTIKCLWGNNLTGRLLFPAGGGLVALAGSDTPQVTVRDASDRCLWLAGFDSANSPEGTAREWVVLDLDHPTSPPRVVTIGAPFERVVAIDRGKAATIWMDREGQRHVGVYRVPPCGGKE